MIIDFRTRPPYKTELNTVIFQDAPECAPEDMSIFDIGKEPIPSKEQKSMELFMRELDESETEQAVIMGRKADDNGEVDNDETCELMRMYPGRFIGFAGVLADSRRGKRRNIYVTELERKAKHRQR